MAQVVSLSEAVQETVRDGASVALEGFTHLIPFAAGHEVLRQGRRELELLTLTGSPAAWLADLLGGLEVDTGRMRSNLAQLEAAGVAEAADLTASVAAAAALVERALGGEPS